MRMGEFIQTRSGLNSGGRLLLTDLATRIAQIHARKILCVAILILLTLGATYSMHLGDRILFPDENDYLQLAASVRDGSYSIESEPTAYRPPVYPMFVALAQRLTASNVVVPRMANYVFLSAALLLLYGMISRNTSCSVGLLAFALATIYPVFFYCAGLVLTQTLALFLLGNRSSFLEMGARFRVPAVAWR